MAVSPNPTPPIFGIFNLPKEERLDALRQLLDGGANPNATDPRLNRHESVLGRACRPAYPAPPGEEATIDRRLIRELLDRGANPLRADIWGEETGEMSELFNRMAYRAWHTTAVTSSNSPQCDDDPGILREILSACHTRNHRDNKDHDALIHMVLSLRNFAHEHYLDPVRHALDMGFDANQPINQHPNAIHYLIKQNTSASWSGPWVWNFIDAFIDGGVNMNQTNDEGHSGWDAVDARADKSAHIPAFARIQAKRQARALAMGLPEAATICSRRHGL